MNKTITIIFALLICFFIFSTGFAFGAVHISKYWNDATKEMSDDYKDILFKVSDMNIESIKQSVEYCELLLNETETIKKIKDY